MNADQTDWTPVVPYPGAGTRRSFVRGDPDDTRLRLSYFRREGDGALVARVGFGPGSEGPPGFAHGGAVAAALDDVMGAGVWLAGYAAVAARIIVDFREMVPLGLEAVIETRVEGTEGRKVTIRAWLTDGERVFAESEGLFVTLGTEQLAAMASRS
ncbi:MAG: PaaI family thioesterase [Vicinamibacterales bacterium]